METRERQIRASDVVAPIGVAAGASIINYKRLLKEPEMIPENPSRFEDVMVRHPGEGPGFGLVLVMCLCSFVVGFCMRSVMKESTNASEKKLEKLTEENRIYREAINRAASSSASDLVGAKIESKDF